MQEELEKVLSEEDFKNASQKELIVALIDSIYPKLAGKFLLAEIISKLPTSKGIKKWEAAAGDIDEIHQALKAKGWYHKKNLTISAENKHAIITYLVKDEAYANIVKALPNIFRYAREATDWVVVKANCLFYSNDKDFAENPNPHYLEPKYYANNAPDDFFKNMLRANKYAMVTHNIINALEDPITEDYYEALHLQMKHCDEVDNMWSVYFFDYIAFINYDLERFPPEIERLIEYLVPESLPVYSNYFNLFLDFCNAKSPEACLVLAKKFKQSLREFRRLYEDNKHTFDDYYETIYIFCLARAYNLPDAKEAIYKDYQAYLKYAYIDRDKLQVFNDFFRANNHVTAKEIMLRIQKKEEQEKLIGLDLLIDAVALYNLQREIKRDTWLFELLRKKFHELKDLNKFLSTIFAQIISALIPHIDIAISDEESEEYFNYMAKYPCFDFVGISARALSWQARIDAIHNFITTSKDGKEAKKKVSNNPKRLVWFVNFNFKEITPYEQSFSKDAWTKGRKVSVGKLKNNTAEYTYLTEQDKELIQKSIKKDYWADHHEVEYNNGLLYLVDHPLVFDEQSGENILLELKEAELQVELIKADKKKAKKGEEVEDMYRLSFALPKDTPCTATECIRKNTYSVMPISVDHVRLKELMGADELIVPQSVHEKVLDLVSYEGSPVKVNLAMDLKELQGSKVNAIPTFRLKQITIPSAIGLEIQAIVRPYEESKNCFTPTKGTNNFVTRVNDEPIKIIRDFDKEKEELDILLEKSPILKDNLINEDYNWDFRESEEAFQALLELQNAEASIEWFNSSPLRVSKPVDPSSMKLKVKGQKDWFSLSGDVELDYNLVLDMMTLVQGIRKHKGKFIPLSDGQVIALTEDFRRVLEKIEKFTQIDTKEIRLHPLAIPAFDIAIMEIESRTYENADSSLKWKEWKEKFDNLEEEISLPKSLQAELRPYQIEGYSWLASLTKIGVGACLADDMGLGKTLQTIALLLYLRQTTITKEEEKPILIVAPTSVCHNWELEFKKFAPSFEVSRITAANSKKERAKIIENLSANQVLIIGYSLLVTEISILKEKEFKLAVFDEAQALKNAQTLRSKSSILLNANSKIALTGTPIENSLEDLWSIFNIINPNLLGSKESFNEKFGYSSGRKALKSLVNPFILRRTKNTVLEELPSRTDQTIIIEPSAEEAAFYEALRMQAKKNIAEEREKMQDKKFARFRILAELTKLRQAACNPVLIHSDSTIESSKMATLINLVKNLTENNHQALIFSQFTGHLKLVYEEIQKLGINTFYLDGSTPEKKRAELVASFQNGQADLFCISLKAGGQGLNLTAADYVIHLDPWWNPAVEDQASDRAYRIGQTRPVTIYRLIMQGSVEEKILELHSTKRELAEDILSETDSASRLSLDDLMNLLN